MASFTKTPSEHRATARRVPEKIRERMPQAELDYRAKHVDKLEAGAPHGEAGNAIRAYAAVLLRSIPVAEFAEQYKHFGEVGQNAGPDVAFNMRAAQAELTEANAYPPGLRDAVERRLAGKGGLHTELDDGKLDEIAGIPREPMAKARTDLERKQAALLEEIRALRRRRGI